VLCCKHAVDLFLELAHMNMNELRIKSIYRSRIFIKASRMLFHRNIKRKDRLLLADKCRNRRHGIKSSYIKISIVDKGEKLA